MNNSKIRTPVILLILLFGGLFFAPVSTYAQEVQTCQENFLQGDTVGWRVCTQQFRKEAGIASGDKRQYIWLLNRYGLLATVISEQGYSDPLVEQLERLGEQAENLAKDHPGIARYHALHGGIQGVMAGISTFKGMKYGPKSAKSIKKALELDDQDPYALAEQANLKFNAPPLFGGDKEEALDLFRRSARQFEAGSEDQRNTWVYPFVLASIGQALLETGQSAAALSHLQEVLKVYPNFSLVDKKLLPKAQEAAKK